MFPSPCTGIIDVSGVRLSDSPQQERGARSGVSTIAREKLMATALISAAAIGLALAGSGYWTLWQSRNTAADNVLAPALVTFPERRPLAEFILVDDEKGVFDLGSLTSRWSFIFFGFMYCPDICPTTLYDLSLVKKECLPKESTSARYSLFSFQWTQPGIKQRRSSVMLNILIPTSSAQPDPLAN